jgi:hypothetical protein
MINTRTTRRVMIPKTFTQRGVLVVSAAMRLVEWSS